MKKLLMAAVALTAMVTVPTAPAAAAGQDFTVTGSVATTCNYTGGTIPFGTIGVNPDGTVASSQSHSSTAQTGFYCNGAGTTLALVHTAMTNPATAAPGFTSTVDYTPAVSVGGVDQKVGDGTNNTFGAQAGSLVVDARTLTATGKLMAGDYSGTITLTLTPAL